MVSIVISEKGGAERRERFDSPEISIGRVKGNDVLLPKGNVSKRHARLIQRDGRFIVTDLKSTNGTYVNHRRITHATLVREGDRIYIGDFVLWIESQGEAAGVEDGLDAFGADGSAMASDQFSPGAAGLDSMSSSGSFDSSHREGGADGVVSHFPIERDPDESAPDHSVPSPPRMPQGLRHGATGSYPALDVSASHDLISSAPAASAPLGSSGGNGDAVAPGAGPTTGEPAASSDELEAQQRVFAATMQAVEAELDSALLDSLEPPSSEQRQRVDESLEQHLAPLGDGKELPGELTVDALRTAARQEILEHGPLGPLLEDGGTSQVQLIGGRVLVTRRGRRFAHRGLGFSGESAVARTLRRLCHEAGQELAEDELYVTRQLADGRVLFAVRPPASPQGTMLVIRKPQREPVSLNTLVRSGTISRGMASMLGHCVAARANVLVVGSAGSGVGRIVDALAAAIPTGHRTIWLCESGAMEHVTEGAAAIDLGSTTESRFAAIEAAARLEPDHLMVPPLAGPFLAAVLDAVTRGTEGVIMYTHAATLRHAVGRLSADVAGARPGLTVDTAREWLVSAFDIGLEVARLRDNRQRVARLTEFRFGSKGGSLRDVFAFSYHRTATGGSIEGAFHATGTVPRIVDDLAARGMPLDTSIFRRHLTG